MIAESLSIYFAIPKLTYDCSNGQMTAETIKPGEVFEIRAAIPGIIAELQSRYHPDGPAISIGVGIIELAAEIIAQKLGKSIEPDEETVKAAIAELCDKI